MPAPGKTPTSTLPLSGAGSGAMPCLGLGVWASPRDLTKATCLAALRHGYRHIDTAQGYSNEAEVGQAVAESGLRRDEIFVTTKMYSPGRDAAEAYARAARSCELVGGYADLFLVHNATVGPEKVKLIWGALERLLKEGKAKAIGVSNFGVDHIEEMKAWAGVWPPAVNQLELHPWLQQRETVEYCRASGIVVQAYCPLTRMRKTGDPHVVRIAKALGKSPGQVLIRYSVEKGWVPLPKSDKEHRIVENAAVFDFEIGADDMAVLDRREEEDGKFVLCCDP